MQLQITPNENFLHAGELNARWDAADPRKPSFPYAEVELDLRACKFVRPPAALWCVVFLLLARKRMAACRLLVPTNVGVCVYLKSIGVFDILKSAGVEVDDRDVYSKVDANVIVPISQFATSAEGTQLANRAFEQLQKSGKGAVNLTTVLTEAFGELTLNAVQHSGSEIGAFGLIQHYVFDTGPRFVCAVADGGIGVRDSLIRNPKLRTRVSYDWDALELAIRERVSGTGDLHRGIGLYGVSEDVRRPQHWMLLHSGVGLLEVTEELESHARRTRLFPGTLAFISVPA